MKHFGLEPGRDVAIVEIGSGDWIVGALQGGRASGRVRISGDEPGSEARKPSVIALPSLNIPYASTRRFYPRRHHPR